MNLDLVLRFRTSSSQWEGLDEKEMVRRIRTLLLPNVYSVLRYFISHEAATARILRVNLKIRKNRIYDVIETLSDLSIIEGRTKTPNKKKSSTVWALGKTEIEKVREAYQLHQSLRSPVYRRATVYAAEYMEANFPRQAGLPELIAYLKTRDVSPRARMDIARMMAPIIRRTEV